MRVLAFDTSMRSVSVAIADGRRILVCLEERAAQPAERLLTMIREALTCAGLRFVDIDRIAVTLGPGGFTGIRVGLAMASGLARATGKSIVAMGSLEVMAHVAAQTLPDVPPDRPVVVAAPAGRGGVYVQSFIGARPFAEARLADATAPVSLAVGSVLVGPGATDLAAMVAGEWTTAAPDIGPQADVLARIAPHLTPVRTLRPLYVRSADATPAPGMALS
jgi:tRNA threonylcarbamoyladenosine biosynthesis protein TsaB